jgi:hypothetical protein|tara:strand:+ start:2255 stop:2515 length:261 start_codon:yes stop_codon:yes gene_type:complete
MFKELKYVLYVIVIFVFIFLTGKFYFSDENEKNYYRSFDNINKKINTYSSNLPLLKNDTDNVIEYVENKVSKDKKKYRFWKLLEND